MNLKTITAAIFIALLMSSATSFAFPSISATANTNKELSTAIEQLVHFPEKGIDRGESGQVWITFRVDHDGWIDVKNVTGNKTFTNYVKKQMELISVENPDLYGKFYRIKINFDFQAQ